MHNIQHILQDCFDEISQRDFVETINTIPNNNEKKYLQCWHIRTEVDIFGMSHDVDLYVGFPTSFPFVIPDFYYFDCQYDYFPHIDYQKRKLCIYEEDVVLNIHHPELIIASCLKQAKSLISNGATNQNIDDFLQEIESYWILPYNKEADIDASFIMFGNRPTRTETLNILIRSTGHKIIVSDSSVRFVQEQFNSAPIGKILYLPSIQLPIQPPYDTTWLNLQQQVDQDTLEEIKSFVRSTGCLNIVFPLAKDYLLGGLYFGHIKTKQKGFRDGYFTPLKALDMVYKKKKIPRIMAKAYNNNRIEERTSGRTPTHYKFSLVGCGSIGSNLCFYLKSFNDASFVLIDNDMFTIDNIGRHLLGFESLHQNKAIAIKNILQKSRPEMEVLSIPNKSYECDIASFIDSSAIFLCTGSLMSEFELLGRLSKYQIHTPKFILWLEPYAVAGHMIYLNEIDDDHTLQKLFVDGLYKYNLICSENYSNPYSFTKRDAGCNGSYTQYSGNDVVLFLSAMFPFIIDLMNSKSPSISYRWIGNIQIASEIGLKIPQIGLQKNQIETFPVR